MNQNVKTNFQKNFDRIVHSHDKTVIIGSKVQCQNCIFAHICKTAIIFGLLSRKKCVLKDIFYVIYITSLFDFMLKRFHKIFANFKCVNVFCKNTEYQTSHKTKVSIVLPICTFMFKSRFFLNFSTHLHFTVTAKSLYMKSCHEPDPQ